MEDRLLKPVPSQFNFEEKEQQVNYLKQKLRHVERKDAAASGKGENWIREVITSLVLLTEYKPTIILITIFK